MTPLPATTRPDLALHRGWWVQPLVLVVPGVIGAISLRPVSPWPWWVAGPVFSFLVLAGAVLHELGHVVAGAATGHRWIAGSATWYGLSVTFDPPDPVGRDRIARSAAGPAVQGLVGVLMAATFLLEPWASPRNGLLWWPVWLSGWTHVGVTMINLLPLRDFDGAKILVGVRQLRGQTPAPGPCTDASPHPGSIRAGADLQNAPVPCR